MQCDILGSVCVRYWCEGFIGRWATLALGCVNNVKRNMSDLQSKIQCDIVGREHGKGVLLPSEQCCSEMKCIGILVGGLVLHLIVSRALVDGL